MTITKTLHRPIDRRTFLGRTAAVAGAGAAATLVGPRMAFASPANPSDGDVIVFVFLRGGADGLNLVAPHRMASYQALRPTLRVKSPEEFAVPEGNAGLPLVSGGAVSAFALSDVFALHPGMDALHAGPWTSGQLAIVHAAGLPATLSTTRSHFDAMQLWEVAGSSAATDTGFLNRFLGAVGATSRLPAMGHGSSLQRSLTGPVPAFGVDELASFTVNGFADNARAKGVLADWYRPSAGDVLAGSAANTLGVVDLVGGVPWESAAYGPEGGASYSWDELSGGLKQIGMAIKADVGLRAAAVDLGGWDTHSNEGAPEDPNGYMRRKATQLSNALSAFWLDMGPRMSEITVVVATEFGRTIGENGSGGTDHGRASTVMVMGGGVRGGVHGSFPTEIAEGPHGDLEVLNDGRTVLAEVLTTRGGLPSGSLAGVLPGWSGTPLGLCTA